MAYALGDPMVRSIALTTFVLFGALVSGTPAEAQVRFSSPSPAAGTVSPSAGSTSVASPGQSSTIVGGPPGPSVGRIQPSLLRPPAMDLGPVEAVPPPSVLPGTNVPVVRPPRSAAPEPKPDEDTDHPQGISLEEAVGRMIHNNLDLRARFSDISQAESDVLTASLRTNPIVYADAQQVPFGSYSSQVVGGPSQFDINVVYPLDLSHKRQARMRAAVVARQFVEASYKDAVRLAKDNLYGAYVDALSAQQQYERAIGKLTDVLSAVPIDEPAQGLWDAQRKLVLLINLPSTEVARRQLKGRLAIPSDEENLPSVFESVRVPWRIDRTSPPSAWPSASPMRMSRRCWPIDSMTCFCSYQPFTLRSGAPFDQKNNLAWAIGMTVPLPIYYRQQGNLLKARQIAEQARIRLAAMKQAVASEVQGAYLEHESAHLAWTRTLKDFQDFELEPEKLSRVLNLDDSLRKNVEALEKQFKELRDDSLIDKLNKCYAAIIRHRKSQLRINTVTGTMLVR